LRSLTPPFRGTSYPLGTDQLGRDILSRIICGARVSLTVGVAVVVFAASLGAILAMVSGYLGGKVDMIIMRITDALMSIPFLMLAVSLAAILGPSLRNIIVLLSVTGWTGYARVLRSEVLRYKESDFVKLAEVDGCGKTRILRRHIFPNIIIKGLRIVLTINHSERTNFWTPAFAGVTPGLEIIFRHYGLDLESMDFLSVLF
jgi:peptide/nickel transport system permease protein